MKKILVLIALLLSFSLGAQADPLYTQVREEIVTGGITLKNEKRFYGSYSLEINLIEADLKNENLGFELLKADGGCDKIATVKSLAEADEKTVVAINGDFFSAYKNNQNFSLGLEVKDEKLLQSHINSDMAAGFYKDNALLFSYVDFKAELTMANGEKAPIAHINKPTDYYGSVLMYTPDFNGGESPFLPEGNTAITVTDGVVTGKGISLGGTIPIPENGYILVIDDNMSPTLYHNINLDEEIKVDISVTPSLDGVDTAFGGGTFLLKDGEKTQITHNVSGNNPRSVIGTNADGTVIYMMTVDGRSTKSRGVSLDVLADICIEMGMVNAINLDGGGSTALVGKTLEENTLHTINTPTENRKVINALAITSDAEPDTAVGLFAKAEKEVVLAGDSVKLSYTAYDKNFNTPKSVSGNIKWSVPKGRGYVKGNIYYPEKEGEVTLGLYYNGKNTSGENIYVIGEVAGINAPREYVLEVGKPVSLSGKVTVFDKYGKTAVVDDIEILSPEYDKDFITLENGNITASKEGACLLKMSHSGVQRYIKITCGKFDIDNENSVFSDSLYKDKNDGYTFDIFALADEKTLFDRITYARIMDKSEDADVSATIGGKRIADLTPEDAPLSADGYNMTEIPNSKIISLEMGGGKISRGEQWSKLGGDLAGDEKNIFIILDGKENFVSDIDRDAFYTMLKSAYKNVFVIYSGDENFTTIKHGVRFISVANVRNEKMIHRAIENTRYLSFNIDSDGNVTYYFKKLYE